MTIPVPPPLPDFAIASAAPELIADMSRVTGRDQLYCGLRWPMDACTGVLIVVDRMGTLPAVDAALLERLAVDVGLGNRLRRSRIRPDRSRSD